MPLESDARRVLIAILVYNGREFLPRCLESAQRVVKNTPGVDVLVLDDCSPDPGWSEELSELCESLGFACYRSPRNLGIPRNMNLGLLRGLSAGYDHVLILNSDVVLPSKVVDVLGQVAEVNDRVASVTAWSNSCSIYSLPNTDPEALAAQGTVDWISEMLGGEFGPAGVDIPAAVGFCMLIPRTVIETVGLFDPVFGRGYCEELDWCLRAQALGLRNLLAPNTFVYHQGNGSTREAGLLQRGETTVTSHEQIIDWRYPLFRQQVEAFMSSDIPSRLIGDGQRRIVASAAREVGYDVHAGWVVSESSPTRPRIVLPGLAPNEAVLGTYKGFHAEFSLPPGEPILEALQRQIGTAPDRVIVSGRGAISQQLSRAAHSSDISVEERAGYPADVGPSWR